MVAEEVRTLAEVSDRSALEVQGLAEEITTTVRSAVEVVAAATSSALAQARTGAVVVEALTTVREDMTRLAEGSQETLTAAIEAERAILEAEKGAEQVAGAAEEQASAANEAQSAIRQQAESLEQGQAAAQGLASLSEQLRGGTAAKSAPEQIASTAEELSATIQQLSSAASQISTAVEQIQHGTDAQQQAAAAQQSTSAALRPDREERPSGAREKPALANTRIAAMEKALTESRSSVEQLIAGVGEALEQTQGSLATIIQLEAVGRKIEKIVESITLVTIQTSMLAVSGAVEAARAGDAGRGFALVSNDIRGLAREASESVERVKDTVRGILDQMALLLARSRTDHRRCRTRGAEQPRGFQDPGKRQPGCDVAGHRQPRHPAGRRNARSSRPPERRPQRQSRLPRRPEEGQLGFPPGAATASLQRSRPEGADDLAAAIEEIASLSDELKNQNG